MEDPETWGGGEVGTSVQPQPLGSCTKGRRGLHGKGTATQMTHNQSILQAQGQERGRGAAALYRCTYGGSHKEGDQQMDRRGECAVPHASLVTQPCVNTVAGTVFSGPTQRGQDPRQIPEAATQVSRQCWMAAVAVHPPCWGSCDGAHGEPQCPESQLRQLRTGCG